MIPLTEPASSEDHGLAVINPHNVGPSLHHRNPTFAFPFHKSPSLVASHSRKDTEMDQNMLTVLPQTNMHSIGLVDECLFHESELWKWDGSTHGMWTTPNRSHE